jgi:hypothetical protein
MTNILGVNADENAADRFVFNGSEPRNRHGFKKNVSSDIDIFLQAS